MNTLYRSLLCFLISFALLGCSPPMLSVTGTVTINGKPAENCKIAFFPDVETFNPDRHGMGFAVADKDGKFEVQHPQGEKGIWPGRYKVTFEQMVDKNGQVLPAETKPSEVAGGVKNTFPSKYEDPLSTPETVEVKNAANEFNFDISSKSK